MNWNYENGRVYGTDEQGELMCEATFVRKDNGEVDINHTYVNPVLRGQGVAGEMMKAVAEHFKKEGFKTTASCSYANIWLKRHEEQYTEIISGKIKDQAAACRIDGKH